MKKLFLFLVFVLFSLPVFSAELEIKAFDFENGESSGWWVPDVSLTSLTTSNSREKAHSGKCSNKWTWDFTKSPKDHNICYFHHRVIPGIPKSARFSIYATENELGTNVNVWWTDKSGEIYSNSVIIDTVGWKEYFVEMPKETAWPSGDSNNIKDKPISLDTFVVIQEGAPKKGCLYIDDVYVTTEGNPVEFLTGDIKVEGDDYCRTWGNHPKFTVTLNNRANIDLTDFDYNIKIYKNYTNELIYKKQINEKIFNAHTCFNTDFNLVLPYGVYDIEQTFSQKGEIFTDIKQISVFPSKCGENLSPAFEKYMTYCGYLGGVFWDADPKQSREGGARWNRIFTDDWHGIEYEKDKYNTKKLVSAIKKYNSYGIRSILLTCLYNMPKWRNVFDIDFAPAYGKLQKTIAKDTKGILNWFELGNEDNIRLGWEQFGNIDRNTNKLYYSEVCRNGIGGIRSENSTALIANSATAGVDHNWFRKHIATGAFDNLDLLITHPYTGNTCPEKGMIFESGQGMLDIVDELGGYKELWTTEYGYNDGTEGSSVLPTKIRADYYVRATLLQIATGYEKPGLFAWDYYWGIYENHKGTQRGIAIENLAKEIEGAKFAGIIENHEGIYVLAFEKPGSKPFAIGWYGTDPEGDVLHATYENFKPFGYYIKHSGNVTDIFGNEIEKAGDTVQLSHGPIYIHGIDDELLFRAWNASISSYLFRARKYMSVGFSDTNIESLWNLLNELGELDSKEKSAASFNLLKAILLKAKVENIEVEKVKNFEKTVKAIMEEGRKNDINYPKLPWVLDRYEELELEKNYVKELEKNSKKSVCPYNSNEKYSEKIENCQNILANYALKYLVKDISQNQVWAYVYLTNDEKTFLEKYKFFSDNMVKLNVRINNYANNDTDATVKLRFISDTKCEPAERKVHLKKGENLETYFYVNYSESPIEAIVSIDGKPDNITRFIEE